MADEKSFFWDKPDGELSQNEREYYEYSAQDLARMYESVFTTGIAPLNPITQSSSDKQLLGTSLAVVPKDGERLVTVSSGAAMIKGRGYILSDFLDIQVASGATTDILLQMNTQQRKPEIKIIAKTRSNNISLLDNILHKEMVYEIALATVIVPLGSIQIDETMITDQRLNSTIHSYDNKPISGMMMPAAGMDTKGLWEDWNRLDSHMKNTWNGYLTDRETQLDDFRNRQEGLVNQWFQTVKAVLDGNVAANLAGEIAKRAPLITLDKGSDLPIEQRIPGAFYLKVTDKKTDFQIGENLGIRSY